MIVRKKYSAVYDKSGSLPLMEHNNFFLLQIRIYPCKGVRPGSRGTYETDTEIVYPLQLSPEITIEIDTKSQHMSLQLDADRNTVILINVQHYSHHLRVNDNYFITAISSSCACRTQSLHHSHSHPPPPHHRLRQSGIGLSFLLH